MMDYVLMDRSHVKLVAELEKVCFTDPWCEEAVASELENPLSLWIVAMDGQELAGYVGSQSVMGWADMMNLAVAPQYRCRGIGESLIKELITQLKRNEVTCLTLEVRASNDSAIRLYQKNGFVEVGRRPGYYHKPREDALILRKEWQI